MLARILRLPIIPAFKGYKGFTLAEVLIALAILGVIATFTLPKIIYTSQDEKYNAIAKEVGGIITTAYQQHQNSGLVTTATKSPDLIPYLNYVKYDTSSTLDDTFTVGTLTCTSLEPCVRFHNGALLFFRRYSFSGTNTTNNIWFALDPDGKVTDGTTNGPGKAVWFALYYNGSLKTFNSLAPNTVCSGGTWNPSSIDPPWFHW